MTKPVKAIKNVGSGTNTNSFKIAIKNGIHYKPATSRYPTNSSVNVICDKCDAGNLEECIGYEDYDLCLSCAGSISRSMRPHGRWAGIQ